MILAGILSFLPTFALKALESYYNKKTDTEVEKEKIKAQVAIENIKAEIATREAQKEVLLKDAERWEFRLPRALFFGSVSLWVSLVFLYSALGITPEQQVVLDIPEDFKYIPYAVVGYWTLRIFKR